MTAQDVYENALGLLDELDTDGTVSDDTDDNYGGRAPKLINMLQYEIAKIEGIVLENRITALTDELEISDESADSVMPYGLAAQFALVDENMNLYADLKTEYEKRKRQIETSGEDYTDDMDYLSGMR